MLSAEGAEVCVQVVLELVLERDPLGLADLVRSGQLDGVDDHGAELAEHANRRIEHRDGGGTCLLRARAPDAYPGAIERRRVKERGVVDWLAGRRCCGRVGRVN